MEINMSYASDDSCQMVLHTNGHQNISEFIKACEQYFLEWDERNVSFTESDVKHEYWYKREAEEHETLADEGFVYESTDKPTDMPRTVLAYQPIFYNPNKRT